MDSLADVADAIGGFARANNFSGVVRIDRGDRIELAKAYGLAHRGYGIANTVDTRFGIASGTKVLTALTVMSLIQDGVLALSTPVRALLGRDLPNIDDGVTVEQLLAHRSGIGDYLDEDSDWQVTDYVLRVPVHRLTATEQFLPVLGAHPTKFAPGERFSYCNSGYVLLALLAERAAGVPFHDLVYCRVCEPAGMVDTAFLRSDEPAARVALGYLPIDGADRTNLLHLPVVGSGDGGIYSTVADFAAFWAALFAGRIVPASAVAEMLRPHSDVPAHALRYGLGFWLHRSRDIVRLEGYDAGVSFCSVHDPATRLTYTAISNTSDGVWPLMYYLDARLAERYDWLVFSITDRARSFIQQQLQAYPQENLQPMVTWGGPEPTSGDWFVGFIESKRIPAAERHRFVHRIDGVEFVVDGPHHFLEQILHATLDYVDGRLTFVRAR